MSAGGNDGRDGGGATITLQTFVFGVGLDGACLGIRRPRGKVGRHKAARDKIVDVTGIPLGGTTDGRADDGFLMIIMTTTNDTRKRSNGRSKSGSVGESVNLLRANTYDLITVGEPTRRDVHKPKLAMLGEIEKLRSLPNGEMQRELEFTVALAATV